MTALGYTSRGTSRGSSAVPAGAEKARPSASSSTTAKIGPTVAGPSSESQPSSSEQVAKMALQPTRIHWRDQRSTAVPVTGNRSSCGMNWISPTSPRSSARPVMAYTCQPTTTDWICSESSPSTR